MRGPIRPQRGPQRLGHVVLTDDVRERVRAVAAIEGCGHAFRVAGGTDIEIAGGQPVGNARRGLACAPPSVVNAGERGLDYVWVENAATTADFGVLPATMSDSVDIVEHSADFDRRR